MASVLPVFHTDENTKPNDNVPVVFGSKPQAELPVATVPIPEPQTTVQAPGKQEGQEHPAEEDEEMVDEEEEEEDVNDEDEEDSDYTDEEDVEDIVDSDGDENYGEQSLEGFPLSAEEEAREAAELAKELGLGSTNEALARVGSRSDQRFVETIGKYDVLIKGDSEASALYDGLTSEITALRGAMDSGIHKIVSDLGVSATPSAVETARSALENYLRVVVERSVVHCEYREQEEVAVQDLLVTLNVMGRPLYWEEPSTQISTLVEGEVQQEEEDAEDEEYVPMEDEGEEEDEHEVSDDEEEMETWDGKEEAEEEFVSCDRASFRRLVDVVNRWNGMKIADEVYVALQTSAEDYLSQLFVIASKAVEYAGRGEVEDVDIKFAQSFLKV